MPAAQLDFRIYYTPPKTTGSAGTVMICHHGAGTSGLSFACFAKEVSDMTEGECGVLALDARRHGVYIGVSICLIVDRRYRQNNIDIYKSRLRPINLRPDFRLLISPPNTLPRPSSSTYIHRTSLHNLIPTIF